MKFYHIQIWSMFGPKTRLESRSGSAIKPKWIQKTDSNIS